MALVRDVSERRRLRRFGIVALQAAEEERRRIARELHDDTAQALAGLLVRLRVLERTGDPERREVLIQEMHGHLGEAVEGVRRISRGLRPPAVEDAGVVAAIRSHARELQAGSSIRIEVDAHPVEYALSPDERLVVYRVVQEAMTNVVRHAEAGLVRVRLERFGERVVVEVIDDGKGFHPDEVVREKEGLGLTGMAERSRSVGGSLEIESAPGKGTTVRLAFIPTASGVSDG